MRTALKNTEFPDVPEDFLARVNDMLDAELYPPQPPLFIRFFNRRTFSAIAACILVATFIGINHKEKLTENIAPPSATMPIVGEDNLAPSIPVPATTENENISSDTEEASLNTEEKSSDAPSSTTQETTKTKQVTPSSNNTTKT